MQAGSPSPPPLSRAFAIARFSIGYLTYFLSKAIFVVIAAPVLVLLTPLPNIRYRFLQWVLRGFLRLFTLGWLPALGLYEIAEVSGLERTLAAGAVVLTANHRGYMDSLLLLALTPRLGVVIKARQARQLTYAVLTRTFDLVSVDAGSAGSVIAALAACARILASGRRLLVFPEGTRARGGRLQAFHPLAFEVARNAGAPVVPVIIHSTVPFMAKVPGSVFPRRRNQYRIRFLEPVTAQPGESARSFCDRVHQRMALELKQLDAGTVWENMNPFKHESQDAH